jgi:hypothetical protein
MLVWGDRRVNTTIYDRGETIDRGGEFGNMRERCVARWDDASYPFGICGKGCVARWDDASYPFGNMREMVCCPLGRRIVSVWGMRERCVARWDDASYPFGNMREMVCCPLGRRIVSVWGMRERCVARWDDALYPFGICGKWCVARWDNAPYVPRFASFLSLSLAFCFSRLASILAVLSASIASNLALSFSSVILSR